MTDAERMKKVLSADKPVLRVIDKLLSGALSPQRAETPTTQGVEDLRTYTVTTAAKKLNLCRKTVYKLIGSGEIAVIQMGNRKRVRHSAIIDYLTNNNHSNAN